MRPAHLAWLACATAVAGPTPMAAALAADLPSARPAGAIEVVATFDGPMPTGVTVSRTGRIFVNFPRWGDPVDFTVAELKGGQPVPYPDAAFNRLNKDRPAECLVSVQSVVVDPDDRLWLVDTGSVEFGPTLSGGPKLVGVDLRTNTVFQTIRFPRDVALETTYLNDIRFDLRRGRGGVAFITDSSRKGPNGLILVDLASGRSRRRLHDHPSTKPDEHFLPIVEGRPLMNRPPGGRPTHVRLGADGIAISHDGQHLYYCPLASRRLYRVRTDALVDAPSSEAVRAVEDLGDRGFASDGLESDDKGRLYLTDYEDNAILRRNFDGSYETLVYDPRVLWPDTMSVAPDGHLYFTANQLHRQAHYNEGKDFRRKP
ncbi:MAG TPA: L-dopachrome tautomerase-related protein [Isosphaeraceae bacterium]|nr:L-dopachrome tautomerase-related protein [Isosphaeraceae bacterium]